MRSGFRPWSHPVVELGDGTEVALLGNPVRMLPTWLRVLGGEEIVERAGDQDLDAICADPDRALELLREVMRTVPDSTAFEERSAGSAPVGAVLRAGARVQ